MKGNLIIELPELIQFRIDDNQRQEKLDLFANKIEQFYYNSALANFLFEITTTEFFNNLTESEYTINDITIPVNYKVIKAFKFFIENEELLKEVQMEASRIIQEDIVSGYLCLSVHPLDYLSISENVHNWRSCHALDGDYRSGNLNYMVDDATVICYLKAEKNAILPRFPETIPWNSKKWRVLLFFSNDKTMIFAGRPYPFFSDTGLDIIREKLLSYLGLDNWSKFCKDTIYYFHDKYSNVNFSLNNLIPIGDTAVAKKTLVQNGTNTFQFNDLLKSSFYDALWSYRKNGMRTRPTGCTNNDTRFRIGAACPCPICGKRIISFSSYMACSDCFDKYNLLKEGEDDLSECDICGNHVWYDEIIELPLSNANICQHCYDTYTVQCQKCGIIDLTDVIKVRYKNKDYRILCQECYYEGEDLEDASEG